MSHLIYSFISFIVAIFFIMSGVIGTLIPWFPQVRTDVIVFILENSIAIFLFGFCLIVIGMAMVINIVIGSRRRYYHIRSGKNLTSVNQALIEGYLNAYWKNMFPGYEVPNRLSLMNNSIHIAADLPYVAPSQQQVLLDRIKHELHDILNRVLGYRNEFRLNLSFQSSQDKELSKAKK